MSAVTLPNRAAEVDAWIAALEHPLKEGIERLREAILASNEGIAESVKWNAPNFRYLCEDRVTFRLPPKGGLQLIFHRGARVKDTAGFAFADESGLIRWAAPDRGVITLRDGNEVTANTATIVALVNRWMEATAES